jgi:hypothetical protein
MARSSSIASSARAYGGPEPSLPGDELEALGVAGRPHGNGLEKPVLTETGFEVGELGFVERSSRLVGVRSDVAESDTLQLPAVAGVGAGGSSQRRGAEEGFEPAPEAAWFFSSHVKAGGS